MKTIHRIGNAASKLKQACCNVLERNRSVSDEMVFINLQRLFYTCSVTVLVNIVYIWMFYKGLEVNSETERLWRMGVILCHGLSFCLALLLALLCSYFKNRAQTNLFVRIIPYVAASGFLSFGVFVTAFAQSVIPNITPFLVTCMIVGSLIFIRPSFAIVFYAVAFGAFYYALGITQTNPVILFSNRINGITAVALGCALSIILWNAKAADILQGRFIVKQQEELEEKNKEFVFLAFYDPMTSLYNRRKLEELLKHEMPMIYEYDYEACLILMDIDHFKRINDNYGHPEGDAVIRQLAATLLETTRKDDLVARWGGEEFLVLLPNTSLEAGIRMAERLREVVQDSVFTIQEQTIHITASFGVVPLRRDCNNTLELAYRNVDKALYMAKDKGRNCVAVVSR